MPVKFAVFSGVASAGGASVAVMTSSSKRQRIERWYVRLHGWNTFALSLSLSLSRLSVFIRKKRRGSSANCTEILAWNLFQITWTRVLSPWWTYGGHLFYHCWKELERGQWGQKVQWILSVPSPTSAITDGIIREVGADIFKFRAIFSRTKKRNKKSFIRFPRFRKMFKHLFIVRFLIFFATCILVLVTLSLYSL